VSFTVKTSNLTLYDKNNSYVYLKQYSECEVCLKAQTSFE